MNDDLNKHFRENPIPINWARRMDKFKPMHNRTTKHPWGIWRNLEAKRSQNAAYNTCVGETVKLKGMWSKIYH